MIIISCKQGHPCNLNEAQSNPAQPNAYVYPATIRTDAPVAENKKPDIHKLFEEQQQNKASATCCKSFPGVWEEVIRHITVNPESSSVTKEVFPISAQDISPEELDNIFSLRSRLSLIFMMNLYQKVSKDVQVYMQAQKEKETQQTSKLLQKVDFTSLKRKISDEAKSPSALQEILKTTQEMIEREISQEELSFCRTIADIAFRSIRAPVQHSHAATDDAIYFAIKNLLYEGAAESVKSACRKICSLFPKFLTNFVVIDECLFEYQLKSMLTSFFWEYNLGESMLNIACEIRLGVQDEEMMERAIERFDTGASLEQKALFAHFTKIILKANAKSASGQSLTYLHLRLSPLQLKRVIQFALLSKIKVATKELHQINPIF